MKDNIDISNQISDNNVGININTKCKSLVNTKMIPSEVPAETSNSIGLITTITQRHYLIGLLVLGLSLIYFLLGYMMNMIYYFSEFMIYAVMPLKVGIYVLSDDKQSEYSGILLRQILVISALRLITSIVPILNLIPILNIFTYYINLLLLITIILVQTPTSILNYWIKSITLKMNIIKHDLYLKYPLSDTLINLVKKYIDQNKLEALNEIQKINMKYDSGSKLSPDDGDKIMGALDKLGIKRDKLIEMGFDISNVDNLIKKSKYRIDLCIKYGTRILTESNVDLNEFFSKFVNCEC
jgi:hypothetical protein